MPSQGEQLLDMMRRLSVYRDRGGALRGPFPQDALHTWRPFLPMDLLVWFVQLDSGPGGGNGQPARSRSQSPAAPAEHGIPSAGAPPCKRARTDGGTSALAAQDVSRAEAAAGPAHEEAEEDGGDAEAQPDEAGGGAGEGDVAGPRTADEAIACGLPGVELAELLGDAAVLADWRRRFPGTRPAGSAPPAPVHEQWLRATAAATAAAHVQSTQASHEGYSGAQATSTGEGGGSQPPSSRDLRMMEYAEAVLSALPPDDEAVVLARQAAAAGRSLVDVVGFATSSSAGALGGGTGGLRQSPLSGSVVLRVLDSSAVRCWTFPLLRAQT
jgi:hypothetical protein